MKNYNIVAHNQHNPFAKLVEVQVNVNVTFLELVYGVDNNNNPDSESLEIYYKKTKDGHFYKSRRFLADKIPAIYKSHFNYLKQFDVDNKVLVGHKLTVKMPD